MRCYFATKRYQVNHSLPLDFNRLSETRSSYFFEDREVSGEEKMHSTPGQLIVAFSMLLALSTAETIKAIAAVSGPNAKGNVIFSQNSKGGPVTITGVISGLSPGLHGMHIHQKGDMSKGCMSTGPHFNPHNMSHGPKESHLRHVGDLGNIMADEDGIATVAMVDHHLTLQPLHMNNVIGRAVVLHAGEDDLGMGAHHDSKTSGNSGDRIACGIIGIQ